MSGLFQIKDSLANRISYYHLMLLMASLPFDRFYSHLVLISLFVHTLIHLKRNAIKPVFTRRTIILQAVFFITVLSTIYSINRSEAFTEWGGQIVIFLLPLLFCLNPLDLKKYRENLLLSFALVCTATIIYLYVDVFVTIRHYGLPLRSAFSAAFTNHNFSEPIQMHATFFSMQVAIALVYLLSVLLKKGPLYKRLFYLICAGILTCGLIQLSSKSVLGVLLIVINFAIPWFLLKGLRQWKYMAISIIASVCVIFGVLHAGTFKERFVNELKLDLAKPSAPETTEGRLARWSVAVELIKKAPIAGYGSGSEMELLQEGFFSHKLYNSYLFRLNAHSEYLSLLLKSGIIGLLIYLSVLAFGFNIACRRKDIVFFAFMLVIAFVSFSENLLDVDKGIFFYAFFYSFFVFSGEQIIRKNHRTQIVEIKKSHVRQSEKQELSTLIN